MNQEVKDELDLRRKLRIFECINALGNASKESKEFGIASPSYHI